MSDLRRPTRPPGSDFVFGLDLGQTSDPTALAVVRRTPLFDPSTGAQLRNHRGRRLFDYLVAHLERFPLGTPYPRIVEAVGRLLERPEVLGPKGAPPTLGIDATGVGRPVVDMVIDADLPATLHPVTITAGESEGRRDRWNHAGDFPSGPWSFWTPKLELAGAVQAALSSGHLKVVPSLPLADTLKKELLDFRVKITAAGNTTMGAREKAHDDIVLAVAVAVWLGDTIEGGNPGHLHDGVSVRVEPGPREPVVTLEQRLAARNQRDWNRSDDRRDGSQKNDGQSAGGGPGAHHPLGGRSAGGPVIPRRNFYGR